MTDSNYISTQTTPIPRTSVNYLNESQDQPSSQISNQPKSHIASVDSDILGLFAHYIGEYFYNIVILPDLDESSDSDDSDESSNSNDSNNSVSSNNSNNFNNSNNSNSPNNLNTSPYQYNPFKPIKFPPFAVTGDILPATLYLSQISAISSDHIDPTNPTHNIKISHTKQTLKQSEHIINTLYPEFYTKHTAKCQSDNRRPYTYNGKCTCIPIYNPPFTIKHNKIYGSTYNEPLDIQTTPGSHVDIVIEEQTDITDFAERYYSVVKYDYPDAVLIPHYDYNCFCGRSGLKIIINGREMEIPERNILFSIKLANKVGGKITKIGCHRCKEPLRYSIKSDSLYFRNVEISKVASFDRLLSNIWSCNSGYTKDGELHLSDEFLESYKERILKVNLYGWGRSEETRVEDFYLKFMNRGFMPEAKMNKKMYDWIKTYKIILSCKPVRDYSRMPRNICFMGDEDEIGEEIEDEIKSWLWEREREIEMS